MKSILLWSGVGIAVAGGIFLVFTFATPQDSNQNNGVGSLLSFPVTEQDHTKGNSQSAVALVEYGDFQCPACATYFPVVKQLGEEFGDRIAIVYRHFPLLQIHANAEPAARASEAAALQGKFWEMHDMLFEKQSEWAKKSNVEDTFVEYARNLGLDEQRFANDIKSSQVRGRVQEDLQAALANGLSSTPTFFLAGKNISHPQSYGEFRQLIEAELTE